MKGKLRVALSAFILSMFKVHYLKSVKKTTQV